MRKTLENPANFFKKKTKKQNTYFSNKTKQKQ